MSDTALKRMADDVAPQLDILITPVAETGDPEPMDRLVAFLYDNKVSLLRFAQRCQELGRPNKELETALRIGEAACLVACALEPISHNWKKWKDAADRLKKEAARLGGRGTNRVDALDGCRLHKVLEIDEPQ